MNNIGVGIFCFGKDYYFRGTKDKINELKKQNISVYVLTDNVKSFVSESNVTIIKYDRHLKSYSDKMKLPKYILKNHDYCILLDADTHIKDYTIFTDLQSYKFNKGVTYIDTLLNHSAKKQFVKDLINTSHPEWKTYNDYLVKVYPNYINFETMWEYFLVINKDGFDEESFYYYYEKLQVVKEFSDVELKKEVSGAGEGISIQVSCKLANIDVQKDEVLYELLKDRMISISKHTPQHLWPKWML